VGLRGGSPQPRVRLARPPGLGQVCAEPHATRVEVQSAGGREKGQLEVRTGLAQYLARLWRYGLVLSGKQEAAEALVQATCLRALERSHQFQAGSRLDRWLFSILHSIWMKEGRAGRRQREGEVDPETTLVFDRATEIEANIATYQILEELQKLPQAQRETLFLVYAEGMTYRETAEMLDVPISTVMSRLATARNRLAARPPSVRPVVPFGI
jgi:RNA polymerase sigma-70 factor (ECF subfamily)